MKAKCNCKSKEHEEKPDPKRVSGHRQEKNALRERMTNDKE
jgi:hypothetical protein